MRFKVQTIKPTMIEQIPSTLQSSDCNFSTILVPSTDSTFCSAQVLHETISSLLDQYSDQLELNCSLLEQNLQLNLQFHGLKRNLAICESHNLRLGADNHQFAVANANLASEISRLQAEISQLQLTAKPTLEQQQAKLVYLAAVHDFHLNVKVSRYRRTDYPVVTPEQMWIDTYPGVSPSARTSDYG